VPYARRTLATALVTAAATVAVALFSAYRLADAPIRGRLAGPDPIGSIASAAALVVGLVAFYRLGRSIGAPTARPAILSGATGGALAGLAGGGAQSFALAGYLDAVLAGYAIPPEFLPIALGGYVVLASCAAAGVAAAVAYAGWHRARPKPF
jgi:ABC-type maltose transport system permease subunit